MNAYNSIFIEKEVSIFKRWSHKSYAVFNSIGKVINIGFVSTIVSGIDTTKAVLTQLFSLNEKIDLLPEDDIIDEETFENAVDKILVRCTGFSINPVEVPAGFQSFSKTEIILMFKVKANAGLFYLAKTCSKDLLFHPNFIQ